MESVEPTEEPREHTKWWWLGIAVLLAVMTVLLWWLARPNPNISKVRARHILIPFTQGDPVSRARARDEIERLRRRLENGEDFADLARDYSGDPGSSSRGGDLGYAYKGDYEDAFEDYVWTAPLHQVSEPITTSRGFHLIEVLDRHISAADRHELELKERAIRGAREEVVGDE